MKKTRTPPRIANYTPGAIVDECAPMTEQLNDLKWLTDFYKTAIKARVAPEFATADPYTYIVKGEKYAAKITTSTRSAFSLAKAIRLGYITQEQYDMCYEETPVTSVTFEELEQLSAPSNSKEN